MMADGFDPPVGTEEERRGAQVWPGAWFDATGYAAPYTATGALAYHTGADLNLNVPHFDADKLAPVYACADGVVTFAGRLNVWGYVIVIRHDPLPDGTVVWSRYGHVDTIRVRAGDRVRRGQHIGNIGNAEGRYAYHLHFDIARTDVLERDPGHWPGRDLAAVLEHYVNPRQFIIEHRTGGMGGGDMADRSQVHKVINLLDEARGIVAGWLDTNVRFVVTASALNVRADHSTSAGIVGQVMAGTVWTATAAWSAANPNLTPQDVARAADRNGMWLYGSGGGKQGWVAAAYVRPT